MIERSTYPQNSSLRMIFKSVVLSIFNKFDLVITTLIYLQRHYLQRVKESKQQPPSAVPMENEASDPTPNMQSLSVNDSENHDSASSSNPAPP